MKPERWNQVQTLFKEFVDLDQQTRETRLRELYESDMEMFRELSSLLAADSDHTSILDGYAADAINFSELFSLEGARVGPFRIKKHIGTGGMGNVYLAERAEGGFEQQVALKLIKHGIDSERILRRFEGERSILARLQHPNIARLLDGGLTGEARPWFAMEYVEGEPIDHFCEQFDLPVEKRLELFLHVLSAVQYAHRNLVVHRDIKPDNILVSGSEDSLQVKLLDFGIAQILDDGEKHSLGPTSLTWAYASPEQLRGDQTSTLSDIYSFGIVLYELLTGNHPKREYQRDGRKSHKIDAELAAICQKAMRENPENRFETVSDLNNEIRAWLNQRPVSSYSSKPLYLLKKFLVRNRTAVVITGLFVFAIFLLIFFYTTELQKEKERAEREAFRAASITEVFGNALQSVDPTVTLQSELSARTMLDQSLEYINFQLASDTTIKAELQIIMAEVYGNMGIYDVADSLSALAHYSYIQRADTVSPGFIKMLWKRSEILLQAGDFEEAGKLTQRAVRLANARLPSNSVEFADVYYNFNNYLYEQGEYERADSVLRLILPIYAGNREVANESYIDVLFFLGTNYRRMGIYDSAEVYLQKSLEVGREYYPEVHEAIASNLNHLSSLYQNMGDYQRALPYARESFELRKQIFGQGHMATIASQANMARTYSGALQLEDAAVNYEEVIGTFRREYGEEHHNLIGLLQSYGNVYLRMGDYTKAESIMRESLDLSYELLPENDLRQAYPLLGLANALRLQKSFEEALEYAEEALTIRQEVLADDNPLLASTKFILGYCLWNAGTGEEERGEGLLKEAIEIFNATPEKFESQISEINALGLDE